MSIDMEDHALKTRTAGRAPERARKHRRKKQAKRHGPHTPFFDRVGKRFGAWTVLSYVGLAGSNARFLCRCDCGETDVVYWASLAQPRRQSSLRCGLCAWREAQKKRFEKAGLVPPGEEPSPKLDPAQADERDRSEEGV